MGFSAFGDLAGLNASSSLTSTTPPTPPAMKATPWLSVPQFGDWDQKGGVLPDYSMDFSKIREMRKQNKRDPSRASLGNEEELISSATSNSNNNVHSDDHHFHQNHSPTARRSFFSYFNCCVKA